LSTGWYTFPTSEVVLSINPVAPAQHITLAVHRDINLIFAINDSTALGAIRACQDLQINPEKMVVVTFGLEGETLRDALMENSYCKIGLAMFPEIVSQVCIEAAIGAYRGSPLLDEYITPHVVLTSRTLPDYYSSTPNGWQLNWEAVHERLAASERGATRYRISFIQPTWFNRVDRPVQ
jgi:ribose transport system substrate-binding protein